MALRGQSCSKLSGLLGRVHQGVRAMSTATLPDLPYDYDALQPVIIPEIMELHHKKHHAAYVKGLNDAMEKAEAAASKNDLQTIINLQPAIRFNGGGENRYYFKK